MRYLFGRNKSRGVLRPNFFTSIYLLLHRMIDLASSSSPKIFYWYIFIIVQNDWACLEFFAQIFLQVYIYYYTEWLTSRWVPRPRSFTDIFILIQNDWACVEFFAKNFLLVMNINKQVERNCSPQNFLYAVQSDFLWKFANMLIHAEKKGTAN